LIKKKQKIKSQRCCPARPDGSSRFTVTLCSTQ